MKKVGAAIGGYVRMTDKWLLFFWVGASVLALVFQVGLFRAGLVLSDRGDREIKMMFYATLLGLAAALVLSLMDYHLLLKLWKLYVPLCGILMLMTFFSTFGRAVGSNQAWLSIQLFGKSFSFQPSELLKISFITTFSIHIAKVKERLNSLPNVLLLCLHGGVHILLVQQGDTGSALIFLGIFLVMIFCAGINWRYIAVAAAAVAAAVPVLWLRILSEDQKMRIRILFHPELSSDYALQQNQAIYALAYGGMRGQGIFNEAHSYVYVPKNYNDLIFSFIGESCGFIGCLGVIILLCAIAMKILYNSRLASDDEGRFLCIGVFAMIISQMVINLGMCLGLLPVIGVTLPLFSAGGSSVLSLYLGLGLVLSVYCRSRTSLFFDRER